MKNLDKINPTLFARIVHTYLFVVFDAHTQRVDENGEQNASLKELALDEHLKSFLAFEQQFVHMA
jgi:hypothetical protein